MDLGASSVDVVGGAATPSTVTTDNNSSSANIGLILGIVIPIGLLCKFLFYIYSNYWCYVINLEKK